LITALHIFTLNERSVASAPKTGYLPTLDGWRAIAIVGVLLDHGVGYSPLRHFPKIVAFSRTGPNGVSLFFAISGFLICSRLLEEWRAFGQVSLRGFYIRRACRILPPAMFYLVVIAILSLCGLIIVSPGEWWSCVFFFRNYLPESWISRGWGGYTVHYWSLAVEEHFYLLWPAALVLLGKVRARWFALSLALAVAGWRMVDFHKHAPMCVWMRFCWAAWRRWFWRRARSVQRFPGTSSLGCGASLSGPMSPSSCSICCGDPARTLCSSLGFWP
jgi:peptidoglycan/LPS O-acetylase OafA/YrhL